MKECTVITFKDGQELEVQDPCYVCWSQDARGYKVLQIKDRTCDHEAFPSGQIVATFDSATVDTALSWTSFPVT